VNPFTYSRALKVYVNGKSPLHIPFWFSNILLLIMWLLVVAMERLHDKGMGNSPLCEIITIVYASIVMPLFLWTLLAVYINN